MVRLSFFLLGFIASAVEGAPLTKRIAQTISDATVKWNQACLAAGGAAQCSPVSVAAFSTLLAAPGPCEQQNAADKMIDLAKTLNNNAQMIMLTQVFVQQPRNTPTSQSVPYCQQAPKNAELNGLFQCQFKGANPTVFVGGIAVGQPGTIPFGHNAPLNPPGSCPANPSGPIADGTQLVDLTQNPGVGKAAPSQPPSNTSASAPSSSSAVAKLPASGNNSGAVAGSASAPQSTVTASVVSAGSGGFRLQNGKDAQKLNAQFATLTANSPCTAGINACIGSSFAQCVNGKFVTTSCSASLTCAALPLVNSPGTSITCTTQADAAARIAATGATGGITGSSGGPNPSSSLSSSSTTMSSAQASASSSAGSATALAAAGFKLQNGKDAQALNAKFATLSASSPCNSGEQACIGSGFAQCVNGKFAVTSCGANLTCAALPLVNSAGTSITCTTQADAAARIKATGATGGITGA
ncbi:hypothetical protein L208DRAFT_1305895 [Tricholoma matsutake]|nr:hypothetical protein L208DRAFT_1305895 [Tricholoma matsutake 945]